MNHIVMKPMLSIALPIQRRCCSIPTVSVLCGKEYLALKRIVATAGLNYVATVSICNQLVSWEGKHGIEWVIQRLKDYGSDLKQTLPGVIKKHFDGSWYGPFRNLYRVAKKDTDGFKRVLRVLKMYGRWEKPIPTERDFLKFKETIEGTPPLSKRIHRDYTKQLIGCITEEDRYLARDAVSRAEVRKSYPSGDKTHPVVQFKTMKREFISPTEHVTAVMQHAPFILYDHYEFLSKLFIFDKPDLVGAGPSFCGIVNPLTKDGGYKVRNVASPFGLLQVAMYRLKIALKHFLLCLPESCVFNQDKAEKWVMERLTKGMRISSIDLSSCSDLLPASLQYSLLLELFPSLSEDIGLFEAVSSGYYMYNLNGTLHRVHWSRGQPLGLDPSFFSFSLLLIMLLRAAGIPSSAFRMIGDDLIVESEYQEAVLNLYKTLGSPINNSKSIFASNNVVEFAGRTFHWQAGDLKVFKGSKFDWVNDPLGMIRQYREHGLRLIPKKYRRKAARLSLLREPIGFAKVLPASISEEAFNLSTLPRPKPVVMKKFPSSLTADLYGERFADISLYEPYSKDWKDHVEWNRIAASHLEKIIEQMIAGLPLSSTETLNVGLGPWLLEYLDFKRRSGTLYTQLVTLNNLLNLLSKKIKKAESTGVQPPGLEYSYKAWMGLRQEFSYLENSVENTNAEEDIIKYSPPRLSFLTRVYNRLSGLFPWKFNDLNQVAKLKRRR